MKLLLDANISWRPSDKLKIHFGDCFHVDHIGLAIPAKDTEIWNFEATNELTIITNDDDFLNLANVKGCPPKVILLRTGNQSNLFIEELLVKHKDEICEFCQAEENGVLEIFGA